jgi:phosphoglycolate phosphatase-like HAD superfamily hydrolase
VPRASPTKRPAADDAAVPVPPAAEPLLAIGPTSLYAEVSRLPVEEGVVAPHEVGRGVVVFDLDGTILDDIGLISTVAADVLFRAFGTPPEEGRLHYLATTGMPFEAQLAQLYPEVSPDDREGAARIFHERKVKEAYTAAKSFPEIPRLLKQLSSAGWTLVVSTGAEREMADLVLERQGLRFWFEGLLGSGQGTKREHLTEYRRRYPGATLYLVGDSRFDMEAAASSEGVVALGRASRLRGWTLTPDDLRRWGARWADYTLGGLVEVLEGLSAPTPPAKAARRRGRKTREGRDRDSPKAGGGPASL